ncbi:MAG: ATP-binding protein [Thermodesulfobacteriota bacterium]
MTSEQENRVIGRASATDRQANSSERFSFWLRPDERVNPFDIVDAEHYETSRTFGLVTNIYHTTDAASHLSNLISNDFGEAVEEPNTPRQGTNVAEVAVLSNDKDIYMPVASEARVRFADAEGIQIALGINAMKPEDRVPAGLIQLSNGSQAVAYIDRRYVLGPEAAHINISGISGLATKTSYAMFLIQSILQTMDVSKVATILLNVKFDDLLKIHLPGSLTPEELDMYQQLSLEPREFPKDKVTYLLPEGKHTASTLRPNCFGEPPPRDMTQIYAYDLRTTVGNRKLDILFSHVPDPWDTIGPLIGEITEGIAGNESKWRHIRTWGDLLTQKPLVGNGVPQKISNVAPSTVGRFLRILRRVVKTRQSGVFVDQLATRHKTIANILGKLQGGFTYVVDIAKLTDAEQTLVFGDLLRTIYDLYSEGGVASGWEEEGELPEKVIVFVDELNKYAPARGEAVRSPIAEQVLDIAERGRSFGLILFSAQQFMSAVHPRVTGNAATKVLGRTDAAELGESGYRFLDKDVKMHLTRLDQGSLILSHPIYRQPVKIRFPRPAFKQGR